MASYFSNKRGEIPELQEELNSAKFDNKREAVKKVIAAMTVGKDVSSLFPHVVKCMVTTNVELKKLVYLYIINYAKTQPDLALMAVNSFRQDSRQRTNPLIRALAVRTMGCIRVEKITEYLCEPLKDALHDEDPYVRKTAAICVSKLYDIAPDLVEEHEFIDLMVSLLSDGNAMVVANTVAALVEISEIRGSSALSFNSNTVGKVIAAMNESTEWGQVFILDALVTYTPADAREAESIVERVVPRLAHANPAVVLSAVKVVIKFIDYLSSAESIRNWCKKLAPPLVSLMSTEPEIQYVALKNINLVIQKRSNILEKEVKVFFCKYNDPIYVKMEKLEIMMKLVDNKNIDQVLAEFKEYSTGIDIDFVRKAIRAIGRCAVKLERAAERCIQVLLELIQNKVNYVVQEIIIVMKDIFRKYPNRYEMIIKDLFDNLEVLDDPEARCALVWIVGEYAERIDDAKAQIESFQENFLDEPTQVQLQILTATVKLFLKKPEEAETLITTILTIATEQCQNPDIRDRAYIYWRLLSTDPEATKAVVLCERPSISEESYTMDSALLEKLLEQGSTLASVYYKPMQSFNTGAKVVQELVEDEEEIEYKAQAVEAAATVLDVPSDLLDFGFDTPAAAPTSSAAAVVPAQTVIYQNTTGTQGQTGLQVESAFQRRGGEVTLEMSIQNTRDTELTGFQLQFNKNYFGVGMKQAFELDRVGPGETKNVSIAIARDPDKTSPDPPQVPFIVQMAMKCSVDVFYFQTPIMLSCLMVESGEVSREEYKEKWKSIPDANEFGHVIQQIHPSYQSTDALKTRLTQNNIFFIAERQNEGEVVQYYSVKLTNGQYILAETRAQPGVTTLNVSCRPEESSLAPLFIQTVNFLVSNNF